MESSFGQGAEPTRSPARSARAAGNNVSYLLEAHGCNSKTRRRRREQFLDESGPDFLQELDDLDGHGQDHGVGRARPEAVDRLQGAELHGARAGIHDVGGRSQVLGRQLVALLGCRGSAVASRSLLRPCHEHATTLCRYFIALAMRQASLDSSEFSG
jgi:hypothetical protein